MSFPDSGYQDYCIEDNRRKARDKAYYEMELQREYESSNNFRYYEMMLRVEASLAKDHPKINPPTENIIDYVSR